MFNNKLEVHLSQGQYEYENILFSVNNWVSGLRVINILYNVSRLFPNRIVVVTICQEM